MGVYSASCLNQMAGQHLLVQLYVKYLERGGKPIRVFEEEDDYDDDEYDDDEDDRRDLRNE